MAMAAKEGEDLLGDPTFEKLENGRFRCKETGHELVEKEIEKYKSSKSCRLGFIDYAVSHKKPPLNLFKQDPLSKSKLVCELTGDVINKSEEHIWKHISGKRFLNKLEQEENKKVTKQKFKASKNQPQKSTNTAMKCKESMAKDQRHAMRSKDVSSDSDELEFWEPPVGDRWDNDDGKDRWSSCSDSDSEDNNENGTGKVDKETMPDSLELAKRTKRMSVAVGPSSFASRKKKHKVHTAPSSPSE